ncbi:PE-PGRS family protein [Streptomyces sp. NPDC051183]|uniref:PE-PGRS family protein n=1 Tax=Streptomyces sp. NPDC051183 TaxID=3155165 RepID=UPI0034380082
MRSVNPDDLDQLAKLLDGRGGVQDKVDEAFTRASRLAVSSKLGSLRPLRSWVHDTAPDLRRRGTIARLEDGDPEAGLRWAGFSPEDLKNYQGESMTPEMLLLANSVAASEDPAAYEFKRKPDESLNDWIARLEGHALSKLPGLKEHEETLVNLVKIFGDWTAITAATAVVTVSGSSLTKVVVGNTFQTGAARAWKIRVGTVLRSSGNELLRKGGNKMINWAPKIRSVSAPGSWLPGQLGNAFNSSAIYTEASGVPGTAGVRGDLFGRAWDTFRATPVMQSLKANGVIEFIVGSDEMAKVYGGLTHAGTPVARAGQANLLTVFKNARGLQQGVNAVEGVESASAFRAGMGAAAKTGGFLRGAGVVGGVASTGLSIANVASQGWPDEAFKKKGAGYIADIAEVGFNASLTAAMVAPTPITIGAAVVTGAIYGGLKIYEHRKAIGEGLSKAKDWVGDKAKSAAKKLNPFNW